KRMSDSEDLSSENDSDYVPSEPEESSDDEGDQAGHDEVEEDGDDEVAAAAMKKKAPSLKKRRAASAKKRTRIGGIRLSGDEAEEESGGQGSPGQEDAEGAAVATETPADSGKSKSRADDLWASFLSDVGQKPKAKEDGQAEVNKTPSQSSSAVKTEARKETERPREGAKVSITKVFDFAGEEVRVTKEVDAESKEARSYLNKQSEYKIPVLPAPGCPPVPRSKRPGGAAGLSAVLGQIGGKKTKMSTLEKSKMDWDQFKEVEGISDELATHNRGKAGWVPAIARTPNTSNRKITRDRNRMQLQS
uniref:Craniofacial development protein 1 n=1 Tax=Petromyzon marinus TaxID=7757 RepID=S4RE93_PETMA